MHGSVTQLLLWWIHPEQGRCLESLSTVLDTRGLNFLILERKKIIPNSGDCWEGWRSLTRVAVLQGNPFSS